MPQPESETEKLRIQSQIPTLINLFLFLDLKETSKIQSTMIVTYPLSVYFNALNAIFKLL